MNDDELAVLDEMRNGVSRAAYVRSLIRRPPETGDIADRLEALAILTGLARKDALRRRSRWSGHSARRAWRARSRGAGSRTPKMRS